MVIDVVFLMDSMVALSWTLYMEKQWKMYIYNRVKSIVRLIEWTMCSTEKLPMYHIPGNCNLADLLTKHHNIWPNQLGVDSLWQNCHEWMRLPLADMPVTTYNKEYTREDYNNLHTLPASPPCKHNSILALLASIIPVAKMRSGINIGLTVWRISIREL